MSKSSNSPSTPVSLVTIANQLATTAKGLHEKIRATKRAQTLTAAALAGKIPALAPLGDTILFRLRLSRAGLIECDTIGIWAGEDGAVGVYGPDLRPIPGAEIQTWNATIKGQSIIVINGVALETGFNPSDTALDIVAGSGLEAPELSGEGTPPANLVAPIPQPEIPIHSEEIEIGKSYQIVAMGKLSKKFETPMVDVKNLETGEILSNLICNSELEKIASTYGIGAKFQIVGKAARVNKEGLPIDTEGKVNRAKPAYIVKIADLQGVDFSDMDISDCYKGFSKTK